MTATLCFTTGALRGEAIPLPGTETRIGRDAGADLVIPAADQRFVSRQHAVIRVEEGRYVVEDLGSTNGTWVNGSRVRHIVLADGDEIQFGRHGPVARFRTADAERETVLAPAGAEPAPFGATAASPPRASPPPPPPPGPPEERPSQLVRRLVGEALAQNRPRARSRPVLFAAGLLTVAAAGGGAALLGRAEDTDATFRRLAADYAARVVLVETGVRDRDVYVKLGNGSGFVADSSGLIVTNKHVVYSHLYEAETACLAESFRRHRRSFEDSLVITVWRGGTQFRQTPTTTRGDRGLGYTTEHGTLSLAALAPDNLRAAVTLRCSDAFGGRDFQMRWRPHEQDNNDLAVLRVPGPLPAIPLARREAEPEEPVMVYGFPRGVAPLETNDAVPLRRTGRVLRTQETIQIDAVVLGGNSGGPLIDAGGEVVGITTRGAAETLNMAIKAEYAQRLLDRVRHTAAP